MAATVLVPRAAAATQRLGYLVVDLVKAAAFAPMITVAGGPTMRT
jgi:Na+(H+)/acetate symporter ActP